MARPSAIRRGGLATCPLHDRQPGALLRTDGCTAHCLGGYSPTFRIVAVSATRCEGRSFPAAAGRPSVQGEHHQRERQAGCAGLLSTTRLPTFPGVCVAPVLTSTSFLHSSAAHPDPARCAGLLGTGRERSGASCRCPPPFHGRRLPVGQRHYRRSRGAAHRENYGTDYVGFAAMGHASCPAKRQGSFGMRGFDRRGRSPPLCPPLAAAWYKGMRDAPQLRRVP